MKAFVMMGRTTRRSRGRERSGRSLGSDRECIKSLAMAMEVERKTNNTARRTETADEKRRESIRFRKHKGARIRARIMKVTNLLLVDQPNNC